MAFGSSEISSTTAREQILAEKRARENTPESVGTDQLEIFIGKVESVIVARPETGFFVSKMSLPKGELPPKIMVNGRPWLGRVFSVVGVSKAFLEKDRIGAEVECYGAWKHDPTYGVQFDAQFVNEKLPNSPEALESFLGSGKIHGLGAHYAKLIVEKWGVGAIEILDTDPERLREISGIGAKRLELIVKSWKTFRGVYEIMSYMQMHGIGDSVGLRIYNAFGENAIRVIEQNPFALTTVPMVGFKTADRIAKSLGVSAKAPFRIGAALKFILDDAGKNEGHTALPFNDLVERAADLMELPEKEPVAQQLELALASGNLLPRNLRVRLVVRDRWNEAVTESLQRCVSSKGLASTERRCATELLRLTRAEPIFSMDRALQEKIVGDPERALDESQKRAVRNSFATTVSVITGGPGTGKTHTIKTILSCAQAAGLQVSLAAPTGRAAKRMEEATGHKASTLHRLMAYAPDTGFKFNEENPLVGDVFIIDESSMIDVWLFSAMLKAIPSGASVILVGDVDQLPSVGAGNVLHDVIDSGCVPVSRLERIHRQAEGSLIVKNAHKIIRKQFPDLPSVDAGGDFGFVECEGNEVIQKAVTDLVKKLLQRGIEADEIQIISPQKGTEVGTNELNKALRPLLNPALTDSEVALEDGSKVKFSVGDRLMQFRNNYEIEVFNGDVGTVLEVDHDDGSILVDFDGRSIALSGAQLKDVRLAYAITIHKSQGTEHKCVIIPMTKSHQFMFTPNLLYTAVTRGKNFVYLVGEKQVVFRTISSQNKDFRFTGLREEIQQIFAEAQTDSLFAD